MALLATLYDSRRSDERQAADVGATIRVDGSPVDALIVNLSASGCLFVCSEPLEVGDTMSIGYRRRRAAAGADRKSSWLAIWRRVRGTTYDGRTPNGGVGER